MLTNVLAAVLAFNVNAPFAPRGSGAVSLSRAGEPRAQVPAEDTSKVAGAKAPSSSVPCAAHHQTPGWRRVAPFRCAPHPTRRAAPCRGRIAWAETPSGFKFIDEKIGAGEQPQFEDVVQIHYTVTLLSSGTTLGTSRGRGACRAHLPPAQTRSPFWRDALTPPVRLSLPTRPGHLCLRQA